MALIPVHLRAEEIWAESGCNATSVKIAARLVSEGYGHIKPVTVRCWKSRYKWSTPSAHVIAAPDDASVTSFEDVARALRHLGCVSRPISSWRSSMVSS